MALSYSAVKATPQPSQNKQDVDAHAESQATSLGDEAADTECNNLRGQHDGGAEAVKQTTSRWNKIIGDSQARDYMGSNYGSDTDRSSVNDNDNDGGDEDDSDEGSGNCSITLRPKKRSPLDSPNDTCDSRAHRSEYVMQTMREPLRTRYDEFESDGANSPSLTLACSSTTRGHVPVLVNTADWDVKSIPSKRKRDGRIEYRVDWASTWHGVEVLDDCKKQIFEKSERGKRMWKKCRV